MVEKVMQIKSVITIVNASIKIRKNMWEKKIILRNPAAGSCKKGKYLAGIIDNSVTTSDKITAKTTTNPTETVLTKSTSAYFCFSRLFINYQCISDLC